jgi:uncharacterized protein (DUF305 family)
MSRNPIPHRRPTADRRLAVAAATLVVAGMMAAAPFTSVSAASPAASPPDVITFDRTFIDMMVPHHEAAVAMAVVALARAEHPEIADLAPEIIEAQELEIAQLRTWREQWYGDASTPPLTAMPMVEGVMMQGMDHGSMTMDMSGDIRNLWLVEADFDKAFIDAMIPHHRSAIDAATVALESAGHQEIRDLAQAIIDAQQREIDEMTAWRDAWYPAG